ncbi:MAG TPA: hypothetical protein VID28_05425 [Methylomirabilota bacterium]|jgi:hypothetical protein
MYRGDRRRKEDQRKAKQDAKRARKAERRESGVSGPEIEQAAGTNGQEAKEFFWFSPSKGRTLTTTTAALPTGDGVDDWTLLSDPRVNPGG